MNLRGAAQDDGSLPGADAAPRAYVFTSSVDDSGPLAAKARVQWLFFENSAVHRISPLRLWSHRRVSFDANPSAYQLEESPKGDPKQQALLVPDESSDVLFFICGPPKTRQLS